MEVVHGEGRGVATAGGFDPLTGADVLGVPLWLMQMVDVKPETKLVYAALAGMLSAAGFVTTTRVEISEATGLATGKIRKSTKELIDGGMVMMTGGTGDLDEVRVMFVRRDWMRSNAQIVGEVRDEMDG